MKKTIFILIPLLILFSCKSDKSKEDMTASDTSTKAIVVIEMAKAAYLKKDLTAMENLMDADSFRAIKSQIKDFSQASLTFTPGWVEIDRDRVMVHIAWEGSWTVDAKTTNEKGLAVFVLNSGTYKIIQILRANPFLFME